MNIYLPTLQHDKHPPLATSTLVNDFVKKLLSTRKSDFPLSAESALHLFWLYITLLWS